MMTTTLIIGCFTFMIHITESLAYCMRLAGVRTARIATAMSFVTSTLLVSRLSNMFQAPLLGTMVDATVLSTAPQSLAILETQFRGIIFAAFIGSLAGALLGPSAVRVFRGAIQNFSTHGSMPKLIFQAFWPANLRKILACIRLPRFSMLKTIHLSRIPKLFLVMNIFVTSIFTIGVLCSLLAGAYLPDLRSTANQLSGIVNGLATIMMTLFVDPTGAQITDQTINGNRDENDVKTAIFFLQLGRIFGTLVVAQLLLKPFTYYIMWVTQLLGSSLVQ